LKSLLKRTLTFLKNSQKHEYNNFDAIYHNDLHSANKNANKYEFLENYNLEIKKKDDSPNGST